MSKILAVLVKKLAEGDFGEGPKAAYWWLAGKKLYTGVAFGAAAYTLSEASSRGLCDSCAGYVVTLWAIAGFLSTAGLYDGALRTPPPQK